MICWHFIFAAFVRIVTHYNFPLYTVSHCTLPSDSCPEEDEPGSDSTASPDLDPDGDVEDADGDDDGDTVLESEMAQESDTDRIESDAVPESETGVEDKVDTPTHGSEEEENEKEKQSVKSPKRRISRCEWEGKIHALTYQSVYIRLCKHATSLISVPYDA